MIAGTLMDTIGLLTDFLDASRRLTGAAAATLGIHGLHVLGYDFVLALLPIEQGRVVSASLLWATGVVVARLRMQGVLVCCRALR